MWNAAVDCSRILLAFSFKSKRVLFSMRKKRKERRNESIPLFIIIFFSFSFIIKLNSLPCLYAAVNARLTVLIASISKCWSKLWIYPCKSIGKCNNNWAIQQKFRELHHHTWPWYRFVAKIVLNSPRVWSYLSIGQPGIHY